MLKKLFQKSVISLCIVFFLYLFFETSIPVYSQEEKDLSYDVSVRALQVPFVASDSKGQPVFDLKQDELELFINGKQQEILYLFDSPFKSKPISSTDKQSTSLTDSSPFEMKRIKFIIIDAFFNSMTGLDKSKKIAKKIIEECSPKDMFILLQITFSGLEYIAGPEPGGSAFLKYLDKIKKTRQSMELWSPTEQEILIAYSLPWAGDPFIYLNGMRHSEDVSFQLYKDSFKQLNQALRTITNPKVTYLINEGVVAATQYKTVVDDGRKYNTAQIRTGYFEKILDQYVYDGGSILKKVDLNRYEEIKPSMLDDIASNLIHSTDAYYEIYFDPGEARAKELAIEIKCKRPGVQINSVHYKDKDKPYMGLNETMKKAYAVSAAFGQSSSRMLGRVKKAPFTRIENPGSSLGSQIEVILPLEMQNQKLDVFLLYFNDKYKDPLIIFESKMCGEKAVFNQKPDKKRTVVYFSIIEPTQVYTVVNKLQ